jgi:hypothetical protein
MKKSLSILKILEASLKDLQNDESAKRQIQNIENFSSLASIILLKATFQTRLDLINYLEISRCNLFDNKLDQYDQETQNNIKHLELMVKILKIMHSSEKNFQEELIKFNDDQKIIDYLSKFINNNLSTIKLYHQNDEYHSTLITELENKGVIQQNNQPQVPAAKILKLIANVVKFLPVNIYKFCQWLCSKIAKFVDKIINKEDQQIQL